MHSKGTLALLDAFDATYANANFMHNAGTPDKCNPSKISLQKLINKHKELLKKRQLNFTEFTVFSQRCGTNNISALSDVEVGSLDSKGEVIWFNLEFDAAKPFIVTRSSIFKNEFFD